MGCKPIISDIPENRDTASSLAIFYNKGDNFKKLISNASKLSAQKSLILHLKDIHKTIKTLFS